MFFAIACTLGSLMQVNIADGQEEFGGPYCGIYAVFGAASLKGIHKDFSTLIDRKYVPSNEGSTAESLCLALTDFGISPRLVQSMSISQLAFCDSPVILHVKTLGETGTHRYRHWILFCGFDEKGAIIYDPPRSTGSISASELLSIWDGTAIIANSQKEEANVLIPQIEPLAVCSLVILGFMLFKNFNRTLAIPIVFVFVLVTWMTFAYFTGLISIPAINNLNYYSDSKSIGEVDLGQLESLNDVVLVDARYKSLYDESHIPGAINIPINIGYMQFLEKIRQLPSENNIIVYCNNEKCGWSDSIARQFASRGFKRVYVYRKGFQEWNLNK